VGAPTLPPTPRREVIVELRYLDAPFWSGPDVRYADYVVSPNARQSWTICAQRAALPTQLRVGRVPRALPVRDIPARSPSVVMAGQARSHGSGSYRVDAHDPVAGGRDSPAVAVLTIGGSCANFVTGHIR